MPLLILKALECVATEDTDATGSDECRLEIARDGAAPSVRMRTMDGGKRWNLDLHVTFEQTVRIKLWDEDVVFDDLLGDVTIGTQRRLREAATFDRDGAEYVLWYEVLDAVSDTQLGSVNVRDMLARLGRGVLSVARYDELIAGQSIYRCSEVISVRDTMRLHAPQDRGKGNTTSLRTWIERHCNPWGDGAVVPLTGLPEGLEAKQVPFNPSWRPLESERSRVAAGFQIFSRSTDTDYPFRHETMDWNWDIILDPAFTYLLAYSAKRVKLGDGAQVAYLHNELEQGSLPLQWRPFGGEYVTFFGRHVCDLGHMPMRTEIHPAHTIVREHTTAGPLGAAGQLVPVNRAIIGMGLSGGFPHDVGSRWQNEFGGVPDGISGDTTECWATDLRDHPVRFKLFPPVPRPSSSAVLRSRIVLAETIQVASFDAVDDFLELCQNDDPADGGEDLGFRVWNRERNLPRGFRPEAAAAPLRPRFELRDGRYFEVTVDLRSAASIPVGCYAIVECGWDQVGPHQVRSYDVTFERVTAVDTYVPGPQLGGDDWHLYYGVNGQWNAWWTENFIDQGRTYDIDSTFRVFTVDDQPIVIRDCGIEWEGVDFGNHTLDRVEITATGPDHLASIRASDGVTPLSPPSSTSLRCKARGTVPGYTEHEWTLRIDRRS